MDAREYKIKDFVVIELHGRVDEFNTSILREEINTVINTGRFCIIVDFSKVEFISAHCLRALWKMRARAFSFSGDLVFSGAKTQALETILHVNLDKVVPRFESLEEACAYLEKRKNEPPQNTENNTFNDFNGLWSTLKQVFLKTGILLLSVMALSPYEPSYAQNEKDSYDLEEILRLARETSGYIRIARLKMQEKDSDLKVTKSLSMPRVIGTLGYLYQKNPNILTDVVNREMRGVRNPPDSENPEQMRTKSSVEFDKNATLVSLGFAQVVYSGGLFKHQTDLKEAQREESEADFKKEAINIEEQIRNAYFGLLLMQEKVKLLDAKKSAIDSRMVAMKKAREALTVSEFKVAELEISQLKSSQEILIAQREEENMRGLLNAALNRPLNAQLFPKPLAIDLSESLEDTEHYFQMALHRHPELKKSMALIDSASAFQKITRAKGLFSPTAAVFGSMDHVQGVGDSGNAVNWSLGFGVVFPLFDGGQSYAEFEKATVLSTQARIAYEEIERKLSLEIKETLSKITQATLENQLAHKSLVIAEKRLIEAEKAAAQEQIPLFSVVEAQAAKIEANLGVLAAKSELYRWRMRLKMITGQGVI